MRVLAAPDKFRDTLAAGAAAQAMAAGWRRAVPEASVEMLPLADGGEGTLDALIAALGGERQRETVTGPLGDPIQAEFGVVHGAEGEMGVVEMAAASGLALVSAARRDPKRATTRGTGELILAASRLGVRRVLVCIGGSATNDGGAGMAQALGVRLLDERDGELPPGGAGLLRLARIDARGLDPEVLRTDVVVATDVDNPLVGPRGAAAVFGPQKGASPQDVAILDEALRHFAAVVYRDLGVDVREVPGGGAAGGLGAGLIAFLGAKLRPGIEVVMEAVRFRERLERSDVVLTGEGQLDQQSLSGKTVSGVLRVAAEHRVPAIILCGRRSIDVPGARVWSLVERFGEKAAMTQTRVLLEALAAEAARDFTREGERDDLGR